jgi:hypothetical protein
MLSDSARSRENDHCFDAIKYQRLTIGLIKSDDVFLVCLATFFSFGDMAGCFFVSLCSA